MTHEKRPSANRQTQILAILGGVLLLVAGIVVGIVVAGGGSAAPTTTFALAPSTTTSTTLATTTTTLPPPTTTLAPEPVNEALFEVSEDTTVNSDEPGEALGDSSVLEVDLDGQEAKRALLRFEVVGIPDGQTVTSATLRLLQLDRADQAGAVSLVGGAWTEADTTWTEAPPVGETIGSLPGGDDGVIVEVDVTSAVTGNGTFDFYLTTLFDEGMDYASKESGQGPTLTVVWGEPDSGAGTRLVGAGDVASCASEGDEATAALIAQIAAEADDMVVFTAGDNAYESGSLQDFNECYDPSWGQFKDVTRPALGAREYRTDGAVGHFAYFGSAAGDASEGYYSYDLGGWHVVVLNSNCDQIGGCQAGSPQEQWLREDLESFSSSCTLAYWHHPLFSSSSGGGNPEVLDLFTALYEADAELVINGDKHFYERFEPQTPTGEADDEGLRQFTVGTGGRSLDNIGSLATNSAARFNESFGVLSLRLFPGGYDWAFVTEPGVTFTDSGSATCH